MLLFNYVNFFTVQNRFDATIVNYYNHYFPVWNFQMSKLHFLRHTSTYFCFDILLLLVLEYVMRVFLSFIPSLNRTFKV